MDRRQILMADFRLKCCSANTTICGTPGYISQDQAKTFVDLVSVSVFIILP